MYRDRDVRAEEFKLPHFGVAKFIVLLGNLLSRIQNLEDFKFFIGPHNNDPQNCKVIYSPIVYYLLILRNLFMEYSKYIFDNPQE